MFVLKYIIFVTYSVKPASEATKVNQLMWLLTQQWANNRTGMEVIRLLLEGFLGWKHTHIKIAFN